MISLYAKGMTTGDIQAYLFEIYGTEISRETISKITDQIVEDMAAWQRRPLERLYPVLLIDTIIIKVPDCPGCEPACLCRDRREHGRRTRRVGLVARSFGW